MLIMYSPVAMAFQIGRSISLGTCIRNGSDAHRGRRKCIPLGPVGDRTAYGGSLLGNQGRGKQAEGKDGNENQWFHICR